MNTVNAKSCCLRLLLVLLYFNYACFQYILVLPPLGLYCFAGISAAFSGSAGTLVRSRWAKAVKIAVSYIQLMLLRRLLDEVVYIVAPIIANLTINVYPPLGLLVAAFLNILGAFCYFL